jgi:hypothetical protein
MMSNEKKQVVALTQECLFCVGRCKESHVMNVGMRKQKGIIRTTAIRGLLNGFAGNVI